MHHQKEGKDGQEGADDKQAAPEQGRHCSRLEFGSCCSWGPEATERRCYVTKE